MLTYNQLFSIRKHLGLIKDVHCKVHFNVYRQPLVGVILKIGVTYRALDSPKTQWHEGAWAYTFMFGNLPIDVAYRIFEKHDKDQLSAAQELLKRTDKQLLGISIPVADEDSVHCFMNSLNINLGKVWQSGDVGGYHEYHIQQVVDNFHEATIDYVPSLKNLHPSWDEEFHNSGK